MSLSRCNVDRMRPICQKTGLPRNPLLVSFPEASPYLACDRIRDDCGTKHILGARVEKKAMLAFWTYSLVTNSLHKEQTTGKLQMYLKIFNWKARINHCAVIQIIMSAIFVLFLSMPIEKQCFRSVWLSWALIYWDQSIQEYNYPGE